MSRKNLTDAELGYPTEANGRIPAFTNRDEEFAFWDAHDLTVFMGDELQPVEVAVKGDLVDSCQSSPDQLEIGRGGFQSGSGVSVGSM